MNGIFVTGIGTDVGKTIVSSILVEALQADYWKPIQAGGLGFTDSNIVSSLISNTVSRIHPEAYRLSSPMSPHAAAKIDGVEISLDTIQPPRTANRLIVEGAGGLMVPLGPRTLVVDLIQHLGFPVVIISRNYLGSINHSLLTAEALASRHIPVTGIIFNGEPNSESEEYILSRTKLPLLGRVGIEEMMDQSTIRKYSTQFKQALK